jgi:hypothetical protein
LIRIEKIYQYKESFEFNGLGAEVLPKLGIGVLGIKKGH